MRIRGNNVDQTINISHNLHQSVLLHTPFQVRYIAKLQNLNNHIFFLHEEAF